MQARVARGVLGREGVAVLVAVDGLVLGAMVAKDASHLRKTAAQPDIANQQGDARQRLDQIPGNGVFRRELAHDEVR